LKNEVVTDHTIARKSYSEGRILDLSRQTGRSPSTLRRWARQNIDLDNAEALKEFLERMDSRKPPLEWNRDRTKKGNRSRVRVSQAVQERPPGVTEYLGNGEKLPPPGRRGAAAALERLEFEEEQSYRRLQVALAGGNPVTIDAAESFWLRTSEVLRRLDLAVEVARRQEETLVSLKVAQDAVLAASEWTRIAFMQFLSSEGKSLMAIHDFGQWKLYAVERFKGVLDFTIRNADKTCSAVPDWAKERIAVAWNVQ
jgi:hypothetical protein